MAGVVRDEKLMDLVVVSSGENRERNWAMGVSRLEAHDGVVFSVTGASPRNRCGRRIAAMISGTIRGLEGLFVSSLLITSNSSGDLIGFSLSPPPPGLVPV